ncbi:hypothetical protein Gpo141_00008442 [Globisporangium polare]
MSAYQEWLQKQERKVVRRPVVSPQSSVQAFRASLAAQAELEVDLAEASDAYKAWLQRREARLAAVEQVVTEAPKRNSQAIVADAVSKYTLLAKGAADSKKRPLPKASSATAAAPRVSAPAAKAPTAPIAKPKAPENKSKTSATATTSGSYWEKLIGDAPSHHRKRGIGDIEAPSKLSSVPHKQRKKVHEEAKHEDNSSSSSSGNDSTDIATKRDKKKPTPLDEALAKLDKKYGALVTLQDFSDGSSVGVSNEPKGIEEVHYWNAVDRFASLT